jgi:hypothetical protein
LISSATDADVFYAVALASSLMPLFLLAACVASWVVVDKVKRISDRDIKIKASCVALLYLLWPSLCSQAFGLFACRSVCDENKSFLRVDLDEVCWDGRHVYFAFAVGLPMLLLYVVGLPIAAYTKLRVMNEQVKKQGKALGGDIGLRMLTADHKIYGMFYSAFRREMWWWEGTIAARKVTIAMIGVFGANMEHMQIHVTLVLVMLVMMITARVRPFAEFEHNILHELEIASLVATFFTLWAGSVFNTLPRCEDPLKGEGSTLVWCDTLSIVVGLMDIIVVISFVVCFIYLKAMKKDDDKDADNRITRARMESVDVKMVINPFENKEISKEKRRRINLSGNFQRKNAEKSNPEVEMVTLKVGSSSAAMKVDDDLYQVIRNTGHTKVSRKKTSRRFSA